MGETAHREGGSLTLRAIYLFGAKGLALALSYALPLLLVRRMSMEGFGLYKQVFLVVGTVLAVAPLGFTMSAFYFLPREKDPERRGQIVLNVVLFLLATSGLVCAALLARPTALAELFDEPAIAGLTPLLGVTIVLWVVGSFLEFATLANGESRLATLFIVGSQLTKTGLLFGAALAFGTVRALVWAALAQGVVQVAVLVAYLRSRFGPFWRSFSWPAARAQLAYAIPFGVGPVVMQAQLDVPHYFISHEFSTAAYAVFAVGCFNLPLVGMLAESAGALVIPRVSALQAENRLREIAESTARMVRKLAAVYFAFFAYLAVFGREFIELLFTERYLASWPVFAVNLLLIPLALFAAGCDPVLRAFAEHRYYFLRVRVALVVVLVAALWAFTSRLGLAGTIGLVVAVTAVERVVTAAKVWRMLELGWRDLALFGDVARLAAAAAASGLVAAVARGALDGAPPAVVLASGGLVFGLAYAGAVFVSGVATPGELGIVQSQAARLRRLFSRPASERTL